jgi:hypothetical protein
MERKIFAYTKAVRIAPNTTYIQDVEHDTFLAWFQTTNDGIGDIEIEEREVGYQRKEIKVRNKHETFPRMVVMMFRKQETKQ